MVRRDLSRRSRARGAIPGRAGARGRLPYRAVALSPAELADAASAFAAPGTLTGVEPFPSGHIHDSYIATFRHSRGASRYLLQNLNTSVFPNPSVVMENIERVTTHIAGKVSGEPDVERRALALIATRTAPCGARIPVDGCGGCTGSSRGRSPGAPRATPPTPRRPGPPSAGFSA